MRDYVHVSSGFGEETNPISPRNWDLLFEVCQAAEISNPKGKMFSHSIQKNILKAGIFAFGGTMGNNSCDLIPTCFVYFE